MKHSLSLSLSLSLFEYYKFFEISSFVDDTSTI